MVRPAAPALASTLVAHHRFEPVEHRFDYPMIQVWVDPDRLDEFCSNHWLWSNRWPAPAQLRRRDYFDDSDDAIGPTLRTMAAPVLGFRPEGPIRMLTQPRLWGWVFNPITIYLLWNDDDYPAAAVLEVTNTPWKERTHYPVALASDGNQLTATFDKSLHVSPFLGMDYRYRFVVSAAAGTSLAFAINVEADDHMVLATSMTVELQPMSSRILARPLYRTPFATMRTSAGIHHQAAKLWRKRVPVEPHPNRKTGDAEK